MLASAQLHCKISKRLLHKDGNQLFFFLLKVRSAKDVSKLENKVVIAIRGIRPPIEVFKDRF